MKILLSLVTVLCALCVSCTSSRNEETPVSVEEHAIIETLALRDRNSIHVVMWTLENNGITDYEPISFDAPYTEALTKIHDISESLRSLPDKKLTELDKSLACHWSIYSPIWPLRDWL
jgi:hypothetical protein